MKINNQCPKYKKTAKGGGGRGHNTIR